MIHRFHILFFLYKSKINDKGHCPIFCRITLNNSRKQFSTGYFVVEKQWNNQAQRIKGISSDAQRINNNLDHIKQNLQKSFDQIVKAKDIFYVDDIYNRFSGNDSERKSLLQAFDYHNKKMKTLIGKDYVQATYDKFVVIENHIKEFIKHRYNRPDYPLHEIKLNFLNMFLEEEIKRCYLSEDAFLASYKIPHFKPTHRSESFPLSDIKENKLTSGISMMSVVDAVIESFSKIEDPETMYTFDNRQTVSDELEKSFPEIVEAFKLLGAEELRRNGYSKKQIKKALKARKEKDQKSNLGFLVTLQNFFEDGVDYSTPELKRLLQFAIDKHGLNLPAHVTLFQEYFDISNRKTIGFDNEGREIKGYKIIRCKFNRVG